MYAFFYSLLGMILINCQEMDLIELFDVNVIKVRFGPFSHIYRYYSAVTKCCPNVLYYVAFFV